MVCGDTYHPGPTLGFITTKYDSNGVFLWEQRYDQWGIDQITAAGLSSTGDIYAGGNSFNPTTYLAEGKLFKYNPDGNILWSYNYNPNPGGNKTTLSNILVLPNQNILVLGTLITPGATQSGSYILCMQPDGTLIWSKELAEGPAFTMRQTDNATVIWGNKGDKFICWQLNENGENINTAIANTPYNDYFEDNFHIDQYGNLYIGDFLGEYKTSKFNTNGSLDWLYAKPYIAHPDPWFVTARSGSIATDNDGNIFFSGIYYADSIAGQITIITCLDAFGEKKWEHLLSFNGNNNASGINMGKFADENYVITGSYLTNLAANKYTFYFAYFDSTGYLNGGVSTMTGEKNSVKNIHTVKGDTYISGINFDSLFYEKQFVSKHKKPIISATRQPVKTIQTLSVYPNPASQMIWINCNYEGGAVSGQLEIIDQNGRVVMTQWVETAAKGTQHIPIKGVASLPSGTYGIILRMGTMVYAGQFVKT